MYNAKYVFAQLMAFMNRSKSLWFQLGYDDYEEYFIKPSADGHLAVSHVIWWQHPYFYNDVLNIFTVESVDEEDILTTY